MSKAVWLCNIFVVGAPFFLKLFYVGRCFRHPSTNSLRGRMPVSDSMWWDEPYAVRVISFLTCCELVSLTASSKYIIGLGLQQGLLTIKATEFRPTDGGSYTTKESQHFINFGRQCPLLLDLNISYTNFSDAMVQGVARHYMHLLSINMLGCRFVTDEAVHDVARHCPSLMTILLENRCISDAAVLPIAQYCTRLISIHLDHTLVTDSGAQALARSCLRLRHASICYTWVTMKGAYALAQRCTWACEIKETHVESPAIRIAHPDYNLSIVGLRSLGRRGIFRELPQMRLRFPNIAIVGTAAWQVELVEAVPDW